MEVRPTYVAGYFYPETKEKIDKLLKEIEGKENIAYEYSEKNVIGAVVPHAGYIYSAPEAIHFFKIIGRKEEKFDTVIIINPSHTGLGHDISLSNSKYWDSPYGKVEIDKEFQKYLGFQEDNFAHAKEHSGEVMLPLLKYSLNYNFKIVPICLRTQNYSKSKELAEKIYDAKKLSGKKILVIASSDFSHYIQADFGKTLDDIALDRILNLDAQKFESEVLRHNMSICGYGPIMALMEYSKLCSSSPKAKILKRGNSGEVTGDYEKVVDYNCILFYE